MILVCIYQFIYKLQFYINNKYKNGDFIEDIILKAVLSFKNSIELQLQIQIDTSCSNKNWDRVLYTSFEIS